MRASPKDILINSVYTFHWLECAIGLIVRGSLRMLLLLLLLLLIGIDFKKNFKWYGTSRGFSATAELFVSVCYSGKMRHWFDAKEDQGDAYVWRCQRASVEYNDEHLRFSWTRWTLWGRTYDGEHQMYWRAVHWKTESPRTQLCRYFCIFFHWKKDRKKL